MALAATNIFTGLAKFSVGRLRPNFIDVCKPSVNLTDCTQYLHAYITEYECLSRDTPKIKDSRHAFRCAYIVAHLKAFRLSFLSGHSSLGMCASTFVVVRVESESRVCKPDLSTSDLLTSSSERPVRESSAPASRANRRPLLWVMDRLLANLRSYVIPERMIA